MPDPFEALRLPPSPLAPDPVFAARLRSRVERSLSLPKGVIMSDTTLTDEPTAEAGALRHGDIAYVSLSVPDVARAASFFAEVLGWRYAPSADPQRLQVENLTLHHGLTATDGSPTLFLCFAVEEVAAAADSVRTAGGQAGEPHLEPYGLISDCVDDQGVTFALFEPPGGLSEPGAGVPGPAHGALPGDLAYVTMEVVDSALARAFYGSVLGWSFAAGRVADGWQVEDVVPRVGLAGGPDRATTVPLYRVDDIDAAVERARAAGGSATDPERQPYGITSACTDDQGTRFYLGEL
jgi:predicted enzyme related to lactoylglutathione lyase